MYQATEEGRVGVSHSGGTKAAGPGQSLTY